MHDECDIEALNLIKSNYKAYVWNQVAVIAKAFSIMILKRTCSFLPCALRYTTSSFNAVQGRCLPRFHKF